jgi:beta-galactosidase
MHLNVCTDAMDPREDLSQYRIVVAPRLYCVPADVAENLRRYVADGGVLCLTPRSGVVDEYNTITEDPAPGRLRELAGVEVDDYGALDGAVALCSSREGLARVGEATGWADEILSTGSEVLLTYGEGWLEGRPAATLNQYGKGQVVYVGTLLRGPALDAFVSWLCALARVAPGMATPENVRAHERRSDSDRLLFLLNYGPAPGEVELGEPWKDVLSGNVCRRVRIEPLDVAILRRQAE